jgi:hypothetical protein
MDFMTWLLGALSFLPPHVPPPAPVPPPGTPVPGHRTIVTQRGTRLSGRGQVADFGRIPDWVKEYGPPVLHVRADAVKVRDWAWRGSMEGVHIGSQPFTPKGMRARHEPIRVELEHLWCEDVGEDAVSIQPRAQVLIRNSFFRGNRGRVPETSDAFRGLDKIVQIDGAHVTFENCVFMDAERPFWAKANSTVIARHCQFIHCRAGASGDGDANPHPLRSSSHGATGPYDNGQPGPCRIHLIDCEAWDCGTLADAHNGCTITLTRCTLHRTWFGHENGGTVRRSGRASMAGNGPSDCR